MITACDKDAATIDNNEDTYSTIEVTQEPTNAKKPIDVLTEAGLSKEFIDFYLVMTNEYHLQFSAEEFVKLGSLSGELMRAYFNSYMTHYTADEYLKAVDEMKQKGLTDSQILDYSSFDDLYSPDEYTQIIKDMTDAGLTESEIDRYSLYSDIKSTEYIYLHNNFEDADDILHNYQYFEDKYTLMEYCNLATRLRAKTGENSAVPIYLLSESLVFVRRNISTYDYVEESIAILTMDGEGVTDWNAEWGEYDIQYRAQCGDYFFIITDASAYDYDCDVVNKNGQVISNITCKERRYDIGEGYVFFSFGNDWGRIMNPEGEVIKLQVASVWPSYCEPSMGSLAEGDAIGRVSEGLFYGLSIGNNNTAAYYYNTSGEVVIDLSTQAVNFKVTKLSDFSDGQARIEFTGADYKKYYAYIDKSGKIIGEPIEITE